MQQIVCLFNILLNSPEIALPTGIGVLDQYSNCSTLITLGASNLLTTNKVPFSYFNGLDLVDVLCDGVLIRCVDFFDVSLLLHSQIPSTIVNTYGILCSFSDASIHCRFICM